MTLKNTPVTFRSLKQSSLIWPYITDTMNTAAI